jgi:hypothetical protein
VGDHPSRGQLPPPFHGAVWYLDICGQAVRLQGSRLLKVPGGEPDLWLALVAIRNALRAVDLAIRVAPYPVPIKNRLEAFKDSNAAREIRNVFEHFDKYFFGEGRLQEGLEKPQSVGPRISILHGPGTKSFKVTVGDHTLEIPAATKAADELLWDVKQLLIRQVEAQSSDVGRSHEYDTRDSLLRGDP